MTEKTTEALAPRPLQMRPVPRSFSLMPTSLSEAMSLAKLIAESDMAPKDYVRKPGNVLIAIQMGADIGLKPMQALQNIAVINGRPSIWGDAALALVQNADVIEWVKERAEGTKNADGSYPDVYARVCEVKRVGWPDIVIGRFSVADAKKAGLWTKSGTWQNYPERMLQMRARSFALRDGAADCLMGLAIVEEAQDITTHYGEVIDASIVQTDPLEKIPEGARDNVERAFAALELTPGMRIARINEFLNKPDVTPEDGTAQLLEWCKKEYAARAGKEYQAKSAADNSKRPNAPTPSPDASSSAISASKPNVETSDSRGSSPELTSQGPGNESPAPLTSEDINFGGTKTNTKVGF